MIHFLDEADVAGKTVLVRTDLNSPFDEQKGRIKESFRLKMYARTVNELASRGARVVLLSHQGRRGEPDFISLDQHAALFSTQVSAPFHFVPDIVGEQARTAIQALADGEIVLLDNVRFLPDETQHTTPEGHTKSTIVSALSPLADLFVNDAFSVSHRSHASLVGFPLVLPAYGGRIMEQEVQSLEKLHNGEGRTVCVVGGAKCDDVFQVLEYLLQTKPESLADVLTTGVTANIFLRSRGYDIGTASEAFIQKKGLWPLVERAQRLDERFRDRIHVPLDIAFEDNGKRQECPVERVRHQILDIGTETIREYADIIKRADTVVFKGPCGRYEQPLFAEGTQALLNAMRTSRAFTLIGGGDTTTALEELHIPVDGFSHVSLGGGAFITYLSGKPMPGIEALEQSKIA